MFLEAGGQRDLISTFNWLKPDLSSAPEKPMYRFVRSGHHVVLKHIILLVYFGLTACSEAPDQNTSRGEPDARPYVPIAFDGEIISAPWDMGFADDPCDPNPCSMGARCLALDGVTDAGLAYRCEQLSCEELECPAGQSCEEDATGVGQCILDRCEGPEGCLPEEFCDDEGECQPDICTANARRCEDDQILRCLPDGSEYEQWAACPLGPAQCVDTGVGEAACACLDDWDCPEYLRCDGEVCTGRPAPPTCLLPPAPFSASVPAQEIVWGGTADNPYAENSPFPDSVQVVMTPLVANLTDDNGDGLIDEGDSPEVIFMSFCDRDFTSNGTLRAIHGGGAQRGQDVFASLGDRHWYQGDDLSGVDGYQCSEGILDSTAGIAVANLDEPNSPLSEPEIIGVHENNGLVIFNHRGEVISTGFIDQIPNVGSNPTPSVAQMDGEGMAEVILGHLVFTFAREAGELVVIDLFRGAQGRGLNGQGAVSCVADLDGDGRPEIVGGGSVYRLPKRPFDAHRRSDCVSQGGAITPMTPEEEQWCAGELSLVWEATAVNQGLTPPLAAIVAPDEGFCAVADVWGADHTQPPGPLNPLDERPEVILILNGNLHILDGLTGTLIYNQRYGTTANDKGGAPNVGDFDGDGFPEIGSAFSAGYVMMDLQPPSEACPAWDTFTTDEADNGLFGRPQRSPGALCSSDAECNEGALCREGTCLCAHQGWSRTTEDDSSRVTGSTLFDFNGDGAVEVIYNDECFFRIYDGATGKTLFKQPSESRTRIEHPIVADVDADGNAEIIFSTSTESRFCSQRAEPSPFGAPYSSLYNPGIEVWGDPQDNWVPARRIWNQHAYHVTHISESAQVPLREPLGWVSERGRSYNAYRAQPPAYGIAPDLVIEGLRASTDLSCQQTGSQTPPLNISITLYNRGEVRVGDGIVLSVAGRWDGDRVPLFDPMGQALTLLTPAPLPPGGGLTLTLSYRPELDPEALARGNLGVPAEIFVEVDPSNGNGFGAERECNELNNEASTIPIVSESASDLSVSLLNALPGPCPDVTLSIRVSNQGNAAVPVTTVGLYLGDPLRGGSRIDTLEVLDLQAGEVRDLTWESESLLPFRQAELTLVIDPQNLTAECDEENNFSGPTAPLGCEVFDGK